MLRLVMASLAATLMTASAASALPCWDGIKDTCTPPPELPPCEIVDEDILYCPPAKRVGAGQLVIFDNLNEDVVRIDHTRVLLNNIYTIPGWRIGETAGPFIDGQWLPGDAASAGINF